MNGNTNLDYLFNYFVNRSTFAASCVNRGLMPGNSVEVNTSAISDAAVTSYFSDAAFIGNSVTAGFPTYFSAYGSGLLGDVQVYARVSYSFLSDLNELPGYMLQYEDVEMQAATILSMAGIRKVFICMGTNDLVGTEASVAYDRYIDYIDAITAANPGIRVFIVSTPPRVDSTQTPGLTNDKINEFNELMRTYCSENGLDYIDINTPLRNNSTQLYSGYTSDGYVHMNNTGYGVWANTVSSYVRSMLASERHIYRYRGT
jgi:lysophospholipase L1-like esterase